MKTLIKILLLTIWMNTISHITPVLAADYPGLSWGHSQIGWLDSDLKNILGFVEKQKTSGFMIIQNGKIVDQWGDITKKLLVHSVRKSFISALYGIYEDKGVFNFETTLEKIGIDDKDGLTSTEKQARILDLLRSRSGVYHPAAYETPAMKESRPKRGSHNPGEFWYYNNWDFNALGGIFTKVTGQDIFQEIQEQIAHAIQMQDFEASDGKYVVEPQSVYPAYDFAMSARDMARFGLLYLRKGQWDDKQVVPEKWVEISTKAYSEVPKKEGFPYTGYGSLWWTCDYGFLALGYGGHVIAVVPSKDLVIVHRVENDNDEPENMVPASIFDAMIRMIIKAAPEPIQEG